MLEESARKVDLHKQLELDSRRKVEELKKVVADKEMMEREIVSQLEHAKRECARLEQESAKVL